MAKANVVARRIRAYERRIREMSRWQTGTAGHRVAAQEESKILAGKLLAALADFEAFLASRAKGPWAAYARALA